MVRREKECRINGVIRIGPRSFVTIFLSYLGDTPSVAFYWKKIRKIGKSQRTPQVHFCIFSNKKVALPDFSSVRDHRRGHERPGRTLSDYSERLFRKLPSRRGGMNPRLRKLNSGLGWKPPDSLESGGIGWNRVESGVSLIDGHPTHVSPFEFFDLSQVALIVGGIGRRIVQVFEQTGQLGEKLADLFLVPESIFPFNQAFT